MRLYVTGGNNTVYNTTALEQVLSGFNPGGFTISGEDNNFTNISALLSELFATEEFSKVKGEALNLSMDVKKQFEKQFENMFENYPVVFRSEVEELYKTIYDLKKTVKDLQNKLGVSAEEVSKSKKK